MKKFERLSPAEIDSDIEEQMLTAGEVLYYARKFFQKTFFIYSQSGQHLKNIENDLRILINSGLRCVIFCPEDDLLENNKLDLNKIDPQINALKIKDLKLDELKAFCIPEQNSRDLLLITYPEQVIPAIQALERMFQLAAIVRPEKCIYLSNLAGVAVDDKFFSCLSYADFFALESEKTNIPNGYFGILKHFSEDYQGDVVILKGQFGSLFQETFTHKGSGTLISSEIHEEIRHANENDIYDLLFLMRPSMKQELILNVKVTELLEDYQSYYIYSVNKLPVATARAKNYGNWFEIGKISTLPRYQGRGRAGQLILQMLTELETQGAEAAFSLSISEEMHKFFYSLGFKSIERNQLPELWQKNYNPARNSKAYVYYFK